MREIGKAYVQIIPKAEGISGKIEDLLSGGADSAGQSAGGKWSSAFAGIAKTGLAAVAAGVGAATAGVVAFGKSAVDAGIEFETSFAQLRTIMDDTQMSEEAMSAGIRAMSSEFGVSASELAETAYNAISATGDTAGALDIVENATKLAAAGFTDTGSALSTLTTVMNAYGMTADETMGIADSLIAVQNLGVTTVAELSASMGKGIATASAYGVDLGNLESAYISLTKNGIGTAEATTYISSMLKELGDSSSDVAGVLQSETGKSFSELMEEGYSVADVLGVLSDSVDGDSAALMNLWGSAEAGKAANAIASQGLETFNENLETVRTSAGLTETAFDTMSETTAFKFERLSTGWENLKIAVTEGLTPELGDWADFGTEALASITEAFQTDGISGAMDALGSVLSEGLSMVLSELPDVTGAAMELLGSLGQGLLDNLPLLIDTATEIVTQLATGLLEALPEITNAALDIIVALAGGLSESRPVLIPAAVDAVLTITEGLLDHIPELVSAGLTLTLALVQGIIEALPELAAHMPEIIIGMQDALIGALGQLDEFGPALMESLWTAVSASADGLLSIGEQIVSWLWDGIKAAFPDTAGWLEDQVGGVVNWIRGLFGKEPIDMSGVGDSLSDGMTDALAAAEGPAAGAADAFGEKLGAAVSEGLTNGMSKSGHGGASGTFGFLAEDVETSGEAAVDAVSAIGPALTEAAAGALDGVTEELGTSVSELGAVVTEDAAASIAGSSEAVAAAMSELGAAAAAGLGESFQTQVSEALAAGIAGAAEAVNAAAEIFTETGTTIVDVLTVSLTGAAPALAETSPVLVENVWTGAQAAMPELSAFGPEAISVISGSFDSVYGSLYGIGAQLVQGIRSGFMSNWGSMRATVVGLVRSMVSEVRAELKISSPSKVFAEIGSYMAQGMTVGVESGANAVAAAARRMARGAVRTAKRAARDAADTVREGSAEMKLSLDTELAPDMSAIGAAARSLAAAAAREPVPTAASPIYTQPAQNVTYNISIQRATSAEIDYLLDQIDMRGGARV